MVGLPGCVSDEVRDSGHFSKWDEQAKLVRLMEALDGAADQVIQNCKGELTYNNLVDRLRRRFGLEAQSERYKYELSKRKQMPGEDLQTFADCLEELALLAYPEESLKS